MVTNRRRKVVEMGTQRAQLAWVVGERARIIGPPQRGQIARSTPVSAVNRAGPRAQVPLRPRLSSELGLRFKFSPRGRPVRPFVSQVHHADRREPSRLELLGELRHDVPPLRRNGARMVPKVDRAEFRRKVGSSRSKAVRLDRIGRP